jgi:hypothetical protein
MAVVETGDARLDRFEVMRMAGDDSPQPDAERFAPSEPGRLHERWVAYVDRARRDLGGHATSEQILRHAASLWLDEQPPELAFVPETIRDALKEQRHETSEDDFLDRVEQGKVTALRRREDGAVVYLRPERLASMTDEERALFDPYDPVLARALRRHAIEAALEAE